MRSTSYGCGAGTVSRQSSVTCCGGAPGTQLTLKLLAKIGRRVLIASYVRSDERHTSERIDEARVRHWEIVNLAMRVIDDVPGERPRLLQRLQKEFARGEAS